MDGELSIEVIRKRHIRSCAAPAWSDPDGIAFISPERRRAMLANPCSRSEDDPLQLLAVFGGRVVGRLDIYPGDVLAGGESYPIVWGSGLVVAPDYRRTGAGLLLVLKMQELERLAGVCGVAQIACPIYRGLRWAEFSMPRYIFLRRSRAVVERYTGRGPLARILTPAADAALRAWSGILRMRWERRDLESAPADPLATCGDGEPPGVRARRDPEVLRWLMESSFDDADPAGKFLVSVRARGRTLGHYLAKLRHYETATHRGFRNLRLGSLQDWAIYHPGELSFRDLVLAASRRLFEAGADAVEFCAPSPAEAAVLKSAGFVRAGELILFLHIRSGPPELRDRTRWRLRPCEGDNFLS